MDAYMLVYACVYLHMLVYARYRNTETHKDIYIYVPQNYDAGRVYVTVNVCICTFVGAV